MIKKTLSGNALRILGFFFIIRILGFFFIIMALLYIQHASAEKTSLSSSEKQSKSVVYPVEPQYVCMINNQSYDKEQIPVEIDGKTYFGCCAMCEGRLRTDPGIRSAIDPVSGNNVDKATAVIGAAPDGKVYYFENRENMVKFKNNKEH